MRTNRDAEEHIAGAVTAWARWMGVDEPGAIRVATERATEAYRDGATIAEACGLARGFVLSWLRHPANGGRRPGRAAA
jgi:hypothetical protein